MVTSGRGFINGPYLTEFPRPGLAALTPRGSVPKPEFLWSTLLIFSRLSNLPNVYRFPGHGSSKSAEPGAKIQFLTSVSVDTFVFRGQRFRRGSKQV